MSLGYRVFVVEGNEIRHVSQRTFNGFYFRGKPSLPDSAGRRIVVAMVIYRLADRKPKKIVRIDTMKVDVTDEGALHPERCREVAQVMVSKFLIDGLVKTSESDGNIISAERRLVLRRLILDYPDPRIKQ